MFKSVVLRSIAVIIALAMVSCAPRTEIPEEQAAQPTDSSSQSQPTAEVIVEPTEEPVERTFFEQLGISLEIPEGLVVIKEPMVNLDDPSKLESYLFYIQNSGPDGGPSEDYFQMYGILQYSIPPVVWEEYASDVLSSDMYSYAKEIDINGLKGLDTQLGGERNRFVFIFPLDGRVLTIAVADPTEENKLLADQIISTLQFIPGSLTDASEIK